MKTLHLTCIALLVMLFATTTCLADTFASAEATYSLPFDCDVDRGGFEYWIWEAGEYSWSWSASVSVYAAVRGSGSASGSSAYADAGVHISVQVGGGDDLSKVAAVSGEFNGDSDSYPNSNSGGPVWFEPGVGLSVDEDSYAAGTCGGPNIVAYSRASTSASGGVW